MSDNPAAMRARFTVWLVALRRLPTLNRLARWGVVDVVMYRLCDAAEESHDHFFLHCACVKQLFMEV